LRKTFLVLFAFVLAQSVAFADTIYNNSAQVNTAIIFFGSPASQSTFGETFAAPAGSDTSLNNFSLFLSTWFGVGATGELQGYIGTWTGTQVGSLLYSSPLTPLTGDNQELTFNTGGLDLTAGAEYVAFISYAGSEYSSFSGYDGMPGVYGFATIPGGQFVWLDNGSDTSQFASTPWFYYASPQIDAELIADFGPSSQGTVIAEPSSLLLLGSGLAGLIGIMRKKKRLA
jgi:hypothetical protein